MSKNKKTLFTGAATAIVTPFRDGKIDYKAFGSLMDFQIEGGIKTIVVAGTTGEASSLSYGELEELLGFAVGYADGRASIIAGCGCNNTERSIEVARIAQRYGCQGLLAVTPYYNRPTDVGITKHYTALADSTELPLLLYNVPSRTGVSLSLGVLSELSKHPKIIGIKEASGNISYAEDIICRFGDDLDLYAGNDDAALPIMAIGGMGVVSVVSNILPVEVASLCRACLDGDLALAGRLQTELIPVIRAIFAESNPIPIKYALSHLGFCAEEYRLPLCAPTKETKDLINSVIDSL
jgi:4-hydroxy-tetrahydrodipicolinate synthase